MSNAHCSQSSVDERPRSPASRRGVKLMPLGRLDVTGRSARGAAPRLPSTVTQMPGLDPEDDNLSQDAARAAGKASGPQRSVPRRAAKAAATEAARKHEADAAAAVARKKAGAGTAGGGRRTPPAAARTKKRSLAPRAKAPSTRQSAPARKSKRSSAKATSPGTVRARRVQPADSDSNQSGDLPIRSARPTKAPRTPVKRRADSAMDSVFAKKQRYSDEESLDQSDESVPAGGHSFKTVFRRGDPSRLPESTSDSPVIVSVRRRAETLNDGGETGRVRKPESAIQIGKRASQPTILSIFAQGSASLPDAAEGRLLRSGSKDEHMIRSKVIQEEEDEDGPNPAGTCATRAGTKAKASDIAKRPSRLSTRRTRNSRTTSLGASEGLDGKQTNVLDAEIEDSPYSRRRSTRSTSAAKLNLSALQKERTKATSSKVISGAQSDFESVGSSEEEEEEVNTSQTLCLKVKAIKRTKKQRTAHERAMEEIRRERMDEEELSRIRIAFIEFYPPPPSNMEAHGRYEVANGRLMTEALAERIWETELKPWSDRWWKLYDEFSAVARAKKMLKSTERSTKVTVNECQRWAKAFHKENGDARPSRSSADPDRERSPELTPTQEPGASGYDSEGSRGSDSDVMLSSKNEHVQRGEDCIEGPYLEGEGSEEHHDKGEGSTEKRDTAAIGEAVAASSSEDSGQANGVGVSRKKETSSCDLEPGLPTFGLSDEGAQKNCSAVPGASACLESGTDNSGTAAPTSVPSIVEKRLTSVPSGDSGTSESIAPVERVSAGLEAETCVEIANAAARLDCERSRLESFPRDEGLAVLTQNESTRDTLSPMESETAKVADGSFVDEKVGNGS